MLFREFSTDNVKRKMKKNMLVCVCIMVCAIAMLSFIEFLKTKYEVKTENKYLKADTIAKVKNERIVKR